MTVLMTAPPTAPATADDPRPRAAWERPALAVLLLGTALLYLWNLGASGYANSFYAQAVQAGTQSWKAMLFGSLDAGNAITVDKPAFFLWPMEISARLFGFGSWSMLAPQALEGVATVALAYAAVKRLTASAAWGLVAGTVLALTPVAVLMFRFNNPDAMLVLLLTASAYAVVRALETASGRWLALAGALVGLGFITKMGQALLVVPAMAATYLLAAPTGLVTRLRHLLLAGLAMVAGAGWWIALVTWWPGSKPWIGGSTDGTELDLALGYNGLGRLFGNSQGPGGGAGGGGMGGNGGFGGATGLGRLFRSDFATEVSWLLPGALLALALGLALTWSAPRTDKRRAGLVLFGGSLLVTCLVFSEMQGVIHPYYAIALAPLMAGVLATTGALVWEQRSTWTARIGAAVVLETTVLWDVHLLGSWQPAVKALLVMASIVAVTALLWGARMRQVVTLGLVAAAIAGTGGSAAYALSTASHSHSGSIPSSGPVSSQLGGDGTTANAELVALLTATTTTWAAATNGAQSSAPLQLASGKQVMAIGGFNGGDNAPTLAQFTTWVAEGRISYYVSGGGMGGGPGGPGGAGGNSEIASWVAAHYTATSVGGTTVYDLRTS